MVIRQILGSDWNFYKNPLKKPVFFSDWEFLEFLWIVDFSNIFKGLFSNKKYVLDFPFFLVFLDPTAVIF